MLCPRPRAPPPGRGWPHSVGVLAALLMLRDHKGTVPPTRSLARCGPPSSHRQLRISLERGGKGGAGVAATLEHPPCAWEVSTLLEGSQLLFPLSLAAGCRQLTWAPAVSEVAALGGHALRPARRAWPRALAFRAAGVGCWVPAMGLGRGCMATEAALPIQSNACVL